MPGHHHDCDCGESSGDGCGSHDHAPDGGTTTAPPTDPEDAVERALRAVRDDAAGVNVLQAGFVEDVSVSDGRARIDASIEGFDGDSEGLVEAMLAAARSVPGVETAHVEPVAPSSADRGGVAGFDRVIAVASAKGGVGKTTVATALACALAEEEAVGLFDADVHGPNVPELLAVEGPVRTSGEGDPLPIDVPGDAAAGRLEAMSVGLLGNGAPVGWRGAMAHDAVTELYTDTAWSVGDTLVLDLPPGTGDVVLTTLDEVPVDGVVVVTTPFHASVADTATTVELFREEGVPVLGTVVNMSGFECPSCGEAHELFPDGSPAESLDAPVLRELPFDTAFQGRPAPGAVPAAATDLAETVREAVATADELEVPDDAVDIRGLPPEDRKERVEERFESLSPGEPFYLVSDRDPSPVTGFLAGLVDAAPSAIPSSVERRSPDAWLLTTEKP